MAIEGTVDTLNIQVQTQGVAKAQKQLNSLVGTLKMFKRLGGTMTGVAEETKEAGEDAKDASQDIAQAGETIEVTGEKAGRTSATVKKLGDSFRSAGGDSEKSAGLFARLGASFKKTTSHIASFASALKRIAMYRFLRSVIKAITAAIGEGITNIYRYSQAVGTSLAPAMDRAKSATLTFKNSIGAALAPVLEALIPVLVRVCNWLTTFNNLLAAIFAGLSGKSSYTAAVAATATWGDNLKSAAGAAKELKRQLLGFDELNVLNAPSSGGGGGGGASTPDYASMFEERNLPQGMFDWLQDFRLVFSDVVLDWSNINGEQLAEKIISGLFTVAGLLVGGVPGAVVGFLLSLLVNKFLFDRDGTISKEEWKKLGHGIFAAIGGAVIGFMVGGVPGMLVGATVGFALSAIVEKMTLNPESGKSLMSFGYVFELIPKWWDHYIVRWWEDTALPWLEGIWEDFQNTGLYKIITWIMNNVMGNSIGTTKIFANWGVDSFDLAEDNPFSYIKENAPTYKKEVSGTLNKIFNYISRNVAGTAQKGGQKTADSFYDGYTKEAGTRSIAAYSELNRQIDKGMLYIKDGDRKRWLEQGRNISNMIGSTDVSTPMMMLDSKMQDSWKTIQANTGMCAGAVSKTVSDKLNGTNVLLPMKKIETDIGNSFNGINTLTGNKMTQVGNTMMDKIRATDIVTPMESLKTKLATKFEEVKKNTSGTGSTISENLTKAFNNARDNMLSAMNTLSSKIKTPLNSISTSAAQTTNNVAEAVRQAIIDMNKFKFTVPNWVNGYGGRTFSFNASVPQATKYTPMLMAEGGIVDKGQLFIAREKGAELIGAYGHQTGVMNNEQIVDSVSEGVYRAVVEALGNQSTTVQIDGKTLFEIVTERNNSQVRRTGRSPLLV